MPTFCGTLSRHTQLLRNATDELYPDDLVAVHGQIGCSRRIQLRVILQHCLGAITHQRLIMVVVSEPFSGSFLCHYTPAGTQRTSLQLSLEVRLFKVGLHVVVLVC